MGSSVFLQSLKWNGALTSFEKGDLIVLRDFHETRYHFGELDDLGDDRRQLLGALQPKLVLRLEFLKKGTELLILSGETFRRHFPRRENGHSPDF